MKGIKLQIPNVQAISNMHLLNGRNKLQNKMEFGELRLKFGVTFSIKKSMDSRKGSPEAKWI
jgi:hypothetical protein